MSRDALAPLAPRRRGWPDVGDPRTKTFLLLAGAAAFAIALCLYAGATAAHPHRAWSMLDLQIYRWAGVRARHGADAYQGTYRGLAYTYTPFALLLSALASLASLPVLRWALTVASLAALVAALWACWGMAGVTAGRARWGLTLGAAAVALAMEPTVKTLRFGQINLLLMGLVVLDLAQPDERRWKGLGVGLAAAVKLTPAIFVAYLVATRRWRAAAVAGGSFMTALGLGSVLLPAAARDYWLHRLFMDSQRVGGVGFVSNQSLNGTLVRLMAGVGAAVPSWLASALVVGAGGLLLAAWASAAGEELLAIVLCAVTGLLVSPISWSHHWVWIAPAMVAATGLALRRGSLRAFAPVLLLPLVFAAPAGLIWRVPNDNNREYAWHGWQLAVGNLYVIAGLLALAAAGAYLLQAYGTPALPALDRLGRPWRKRR